MKTFAHTETNNELIRGKKYCCAIHVLHIEYLMWKLRLWKGNCLNWIEREREKIVSGAVNNNIPFFFPFFLVIKHQKIQIIYQTINRLWGMTMQPNRSNKQFHWKEYKWKWNGTSRMFACVQLRECAIVSVYSSVACAEIGLNELFWSKLIRIQSYGRNMMRCDGRWCTWLNVNSE